MSYVKIEDLGWDTMPNGTLVSTLFLTDAGQTAENPSDPENPFHGPTTVEYQVIEGQLTANTYPIAEMPRNDLYLS